MGIGQNRLFYGVLFLFLSFKIAIANEFFKENESNESIASNMLANMRDEEILSGIFLLTWQGKESDDNIKKWVSNRSLGGIKIFGWNYVNSNTLSEDISQLQSLANSKDNPIPLLVATDQEGGWVRHVKSNTLETAGNMSIGASGLPYDAYYTGLYIGEELKKIGINFNLAPSVDVYRNKESDIIGTRSFSEFPNLVSELSIAYFKGLESVKIVSTAKHFPGHGNTKDDSHGNIPVIKDDLPFIMEDDLIPYRSLIKEGLPTIMVGQLNYKNITLDDRPATLSKHLLFDILRDKLGFQGVILSDDMSMSSIQGYAISKGLSEDELIIEAVNAGVNLLMFSSRFEYNGVVWNNLLKEYRKKGEFYSKVKDSFKRIMLLKLKYLKGEGSVPLNVQPDYGPLYTLDSEDFFQSQALRGATLVKGQNIPIKFKKGDRVLAVSPDLEFLNEAHIFIDGVDSLKISLYPSSKPMEESEIRSTLNVLKRYDKVIFNLINKHTLSLLERLEPIKDKIYVISSLSPYLLERTPWILSAVAVYGWYKEAFKAGFSVLLGDFKPVGKIPFKMNL